MITIAVPEIADDEIPWELFETERTAMNPDGSNSVHRYQVIRVRRPHPRSDEQQLECWIDMGDASQYHTEPTYIFHGGFPPEAGFKPVTVGTLREWAQQVREGKTFAEERGLNLEQSEFAEMIYRTASERRALARRQSTFGPRHIKVRSSQ